MDGPAVRGFNRLNQIFLLRKMGVEKENGRRLSEKEADSAVFALVFFYSFFLPLSSDLSRTRPSTPFSGVFSFLFFLSFSYLSSFSFYLSCFFFHPHFFMLLPFFPWLPPLALSSSPVKVGCLLGCLAVVQSVVPSASSLASCLAQVLALPTDPPQCVVH